MIAGASDADLCEPLIRPDRGFLVGDRVSALLANERAGDAMGRLIVLYPDDARCVIDVGEWYVAEGEHDRAGKDQLSQASAVLLGRKTYEALPPTGPR